MVPLDAYASLFVPGQQAGAGLLRSAMLGAQGATLGVAVAVIMVLVSRRAPGGLSRWITALAGLPGSVSHIVMAIGFILAFAGPPFNLAGTLTILLLCYVTIYMPQVYFSASSAIGQVGNELMDASHTSGAGAGRTFRRILVPLASRGIIGGWMLAFVLILGELTASVMLASTQTAVVGSVILDLYNNGTYPVLAALCAIVTVLSGLVLVLVTVITGGAGPVKRD